MAEFYTYVYHVNGVAAYVGKGQYHKVAKRDRCLNHLFVKTPRTRWEKVIAKVVRDEVPFEVTIVEMPSEQAAFDEEKRLITFFGRRDLGTGTLHNGTNGGDGSGGYRVTAEVKAIISAASKATNARPDVKAKISAASKALWADPEHRAMMKAKTKAMNADLAYKVRHSAALKASLASLEARARMSATAKAVNADPEYKAKQSAGIKAAWARRKAIDTHPMPPTPQQV
jgi:hypothetical protein